jgi:hypothetical protein
MTGNLKRIHVNKHNIAWNLKHDAHKPTLTVKAGKANHYGFRVIIDGPSVLVDAVECGLKTLSCGARVFIETRSKVTVDGVTIT